MACGDKKPCGCKEPCGCKKKKSCGCKEEETCAPVCPVPQQIDTKDIFYKLNDSCFSNMSQLDIPKGADLEFILERFAYFIENFSYFEITENSYGAKDLTTLMESMKVDINLIRDCCTAKQLEIDTLKADIILIKTKLQQLEFPQITDSRGLGFTISSSMKNILQTLANTP